MINLETIAYVIVEDAVDPVKFDFQRRTKNEDISHQESEAAPLHYLEHNVLLTTFETYKNNDSS